MGRSCYAGFKGNIIMKYVNKVINRYKKDGLFGGTSHYVKCLISVLLIVKNFILSKITEIIICAEKLLPLRNIIVFECESDMDDNPRALYEYLIKSEWKNKYKIVWIVKDVNKCKKLFSRKNVIFINRFSHSKYNRIRLNYYLSVTKVFFFSHPYWYTKRKKEQIIVHTNHGTPIKGREKDAADFSNTFDWLIVPTEFCKKLNHDFWLCSYDKMFICGYPRNDFFFTGNKQAIFKKFNISDNSKVVICMPTYKKSVIKTDSDQLDCFSLDVISSKDELIYLNTILKKNSIHLIIKIHPLQVLDELEKDSYSNIHYTINSELLEKKILLYELLGCCDALITDVSSVYVDFLLLNRPIGFLYNSIIQYSRGFTLQDFQNYMPGPSIRCLRDLERFIVDLKNNNDTYLKERSVINSIFNPLPDNYSERVLNKFIK